MKIGSYIYELEDSIRLDKFLANYFPDLSRTRLKLSIKSGHILVNGSHVKPSYILCKSDQIKYEFVEEIQKQVYMEPVEMELDILYEDQHIICINKPAGLVVHPGAGNHTNTLANGLIYHFNSLSNVNGNSRPGIVHRLDKNTSGVILIAKTNEAHNHLASQFQNRTVQKTYLAVTWGEWAELEGTLCGNIARKKSDPTTYTVSNDGRISETKYKVAYQNRYFSQVIFMPKTGRTHQIRVHAAEENHPIVCDDPYGGGLNRAKGFIPEVAVKMKKIMKNIGRQALHAEKISFQHPILKNPINITAPYPSDFVNLMDAVRDFDG
ncbi:MAG: RluA family pseudouridine synthase [Candidatus Marinimicrobia bacterium]|nr:RluA family pseudouridine synthase [Candidatus Neomarinimicrobiota bacterium]